MTSVPAQVRDVSEPAIGDAPKRTGRYFGPISLALLINVPLFLMPLGTDRARNLSRPNASDAISVTIIVPAPSGSSDLAASGVIGQGEDRPVLPPPHRESSPRIALTVQTLEPNDGRQSHLLPPPSSSNSAGNPSAPVFAETRAMLRSILCSSSSEHTRDAAECNRLRAEGGVRFVEFAAARQIAQVSDQTTLKASEIRALYGLDVEPYVSTNPFSALPTILALPSPTHASSDEMRDRRAPAVPDPVFGD
tara:strand:+ start:33696 stop:34445 length:750 start_codon:yes stop_codon:yes gene_type:complete